MSKGIKSFPVVHLLLFVVLFGGLTVAASCKGDSMKNLERGMRYAKAKLQPDDNMVNQLALEQARKKGMNPAMYLTRGVKKPEAYPKFIWNAPPSPWSVVVRPGQEKGLLLIEGYGADVDKPLMVEQARFVVK